MEEPGEHREIVVPALDEEKLKTLRGLRTATSGLRKATADALWARARAGDERASEAALDLTGRRRLNTLEAVEGACRTARETLGETEDNKDWTRHGVEALERAVRTLRAATARTSEEINTATEASMVAGAMLRHGHVAVIARNAKAVQHVLLDGTPDEIAEGLADLDARELWLTNVVGAPMDLTWTTQADRKKHAAKKHR